MGVNSRAELADAKPRCRARCARRRWSDGVGMHGARHRVSLVRHGARARCADRPLCGVRPRRDGAERRRDPRLLASGRRNRRRAMPSSGRMRGCGPARIGENAHIGNFVEVKNSRIEEGAKANHLTYLGDATVGAGANIGAGTITCNYDGFDKHRTDIGAGAFIGSNAALVAPVTVGDGAYVGAGSVITKRVSNGRAGGDARRTDGKARLGGEHSAHGKKPERRREASMCGIVGIAGTGDAAPVILEALKRLEYRGYDSAGIATLVDGHIERRRAPGKLAKLAEALRDRSAARNHRHRPYALGDAWRADGIQRPSPCLRARGAGAQRHHREFPRAARRAGRQGTQLRIRDRHRSRGSSGHGLSRRRA